MTIITLAQRKGGAGKTTLACQISAALMRSGRRVCGVDLDDQRSFTRWAGARRKTLGYKDPFRIEAPSEFAIATTLRRARDSGDFVVIDTAPSADATVERAIRAADIVIAPLQLSPIDLDAAMPTCALIGKAQKTALFVINRTPPRARIADIIREQLTKHRLPVAATELGNRAAFAESMLSGLGVVESAPSSIAAAEIAALADEIAGALRSAAAAA
jgi:chromosome partitioning protein